jgi:hypothetical protein
MDVFNILQVSEPIQFGEKEKFVQGKIGGARGVL